MASWCSVFRGNPETWGERCEALEKALEFHAGTSDEEETYSHADKPTADQVVETAKTFGAYLHGEVQRGTRPRANSHARQRD